MGRFLRIGPTLEVGLRLVLHQVNTLFYSGGLHIGLVLGLQGGIKGHCHGDLRRICGVLVCSKEGEGLLLWTFGLRFEKIIFNFFGD